MEVTFCLTLKNGLIVRLNILKVGAFLMSIGNEFHILGPWNNIEIFFSTFVADTNFMSGTQKMFLILFRNILCPQQCVLVYQGL